ncbi:HAMP domain-containing protein [Serratia ureilytica]
MAERIAGGDLRQAQTSTRRDELGQLLNAVAAMSQNLRTMIEKIQMGVSRSPPPRRKSPPATPTSPHAPNSRRRRSRKPPPAWNS